jgi:hypothetical protein
MAYTKISDDSDQVATERAVASARTSAAVADVADVQRVNYGGRTVEIARVNHAALGRPTDPQYEANLASTMTRVNQIGVNTATVVNFLPIQLKSDSVLDPLRGVIIRPPKDDEDFSVHIFKDVHYEPVRMGMDSPLIAIDTHPIVLASEFAKINPQGVFSFIGIPSDLQSKAWRDRVSPEMQHSGRTYGQVFDDTYAAAVMWMQDKLRAGNESDRMKRNPSEPEKASARRLHVRGHIKEMPNWVERQRDVHQKIPMCPNCQRPCEPGSAQCTNPNCNYIIDPAKSYEIGAIGEDHPSLERLTRAQVKALGITDYVAETIDEKPRRLESGIPKPLSHSAQQMLEANDELQMLHQKGLVEGVAKAVKAADNKQPPAAPQVPQEPKSKPKE